LDDDARLKVVRKMYAMRFHEAPPERRSIDQLRGIEGARVKRLYELLAQEHGISWRRRDYDPTNWSAADVPNRCLSSATSCLYGLAEAAILAAGYAPAIGFSDSNWYCWIRRSLVSSNRMLQVRCWMGRPAQSLGPPCGV